jgi:hypothetical protein
MEVHDLPVGVATIGLPQEVYPRVSDPGSLRRLHDDEGRHGTVIPIAEINTNRRQ